MKKLMVDIFKDKIYNTFDEEQEEYFVDLS